MTRAIAVGRRIRHLRLFPIPALLSALLFIAPACATAPTAPPAPTTAGSPDASRTAPAPILILVGFDGFRWDYVGRVPTPTLDRLAAGGARADALVPIFPTKTFPNHYSLATGLYAEHHGVISNTMWDDAIGSWFSMSNREAVGDGRWWGGEPIWVTVEKAGRASAPVFWPGSEAEIDGVRPRHWRPFDNAFTAEQRVDELLGWLDLPPSERPAFLSFYMDDVDVAGHRHGPGSVHVDSAIERVDRALGRLVAGLEVRGLFSHVTLVVVSDHGMAESPAEQKIFLDDYVDLDTITVTDWSPVLLAGSKTGDDEALVVALAGKHPHLTVYRRRDLPERMYFKSHPRVPGVVAVADEGWNIGRRPRPGDKPGWPSLGTHGYDNIVRSMHGIFIAHGPGIEPGVRLRSIDAVDVYELMAAALELVPAPNDGRFETIAAVLRPDVRAAAEARRSREAVAAPK